jgi:signal transduction histidine kinase
MSAAQIENPVVLVVDDARDSRFLIRCALVAAGFQVVEASDGQEALELLSRVRFDVVLLDVCMPGMTGYEVCRELKANEATRKLPVILMSAVADRHAIAQGFAVGGVDYLAKPFRGEELCARVAVHAELNRARRELEESHARLASLNREKDQMFGMAAHDLRGPISVIMGFAEHAMKLLDEGDTRPNRHALEVIRHEAEQMNHFLATLLDLNDLERGGVALRLRDQDLVTSCRQAVGRAGPQATGKNIGLWLACAEDALVVRADRSGLRRLLDNLISNAVKFTPAGGRVTIRVQRNDNEAQCVVADTGPGLTPEDMELAFTRFARLTAKPTAGEKSTGLGLAICRALTEGMGGRIWCGNNPEGGAFFAFSLPVSSTATPAVSVAAGSQSGLLGDALSTSPFPHLLSDRTRA